MFFHFSFSQIDTATLFTAVKSSTIRNNNNNQKTFVCKCRRYNILFTQLTVEKNKVIEHEKRFAFVSGVSLNK